MKVLLTLFLGALIVPPGLTAGLIINTPPSMSASVGEFVALEGILFNDGQETLYLNGLTLSTDADPQDLWYDSQPFLDTAPLFLLAGEYSAPMTFFSVQALQEGSYTFAYSLIGGSTSDGQDVIGSRDLDFHATPEPKTFGLFALLFFRAAFAIRKRKAAADLS